MEVLIYKDDMKKRILYAFESESAFNFFINKVMKFKIVDSFDEKFLVLIPDEFLLKEVYKDKTWYRSRDKKFGVFKREEEWRVVFQQ